MLYTYIGELALCVHIGGITGRRSDDLTGIERLRFIYCELGAPHVYREQPPWRIKRIIAVEFPCRLIYVRALAPVSLCVRVCVPKGLTFMAFADLTSLSGGLLLSN